MGIPASAETVLLRNNTDIIKTTYSNGTEIILNYSNADYIYNGVTINANNYKVVKEGI